MLAKHGYGCEVYENVTGKDGYINTLHRILPRYVKTETNPGHEAPRIRKVTYLHHGFGGSAADFVMGAPENSLGKCILYL